MTTYVVQNDFTHGELDRRFFSKNDLRVYRKSGQQLRDVFVSAQGGCVRRPGTQAITTLNAVSNHYRMFDLEHLDGNKYLLIALDNKLKIFFEDAEVAELIAPWNGVKLEDGTIVSEQTETTEIFVNEDTVPHELVRTSHPGGWELVNKISPAAGFERYQFRNLPTTDFGEINYDDFTFTMTGTLTSGGTATLTSSSPAFNANHEGGRVRGLSPPSTLEFGVARISSFTSDTSVDIEIISDFNSQFASGLKGKDIEIEETAINDDRGWPRAITFRQGRTIYGGTRSLPMSFFGSNINAFNDFSLGKGQPDEGIFVDIKEGKGNKIKYFANDRGLQIFTDKSEFVVVQPTGENLSPGNFAIEKQSSEGSSNVPPTVIDNQTLYVRNGGSAVMSFILSSDTSTYDSVPASIFSPHLIRNPVDMDAVKSSSEDDSNFVFVVNADGTLAVYQSLLIENISAWTLSSTDGLIKRVKVVGETVYLIVERIIDGITVQNLEKINLNTFTDATIEQDHGSPISVITGLSSLEGKLVDVRGELTSGDGFFALPQATVSGGQVTLPEGIEVETSQVGLPYRPVVQPMPVNLVTDRGPASYLLKNIPRVFVDYYESLGILVDGSPVEELDSFGILDAPPEPLSGIGEVSNTFGWDRRLAPTITQDAPLPMTILGMGYEVQI